MRNRQQDLNEDRMRMAMLPKECQVLPTASWVPLVKMKNVYVLPGIPSLVEKMLTFAQIHFVGAPFHRAMVWYAYIMFPIYSDINYCRFTLFKWRAILLEK